MSYHRSGHPGAVAVSYSTSTMSPLSPSRRYSGSTGTSGNSGTNSSATSKYTTYRSSGSSTSLGGDRNGGYYSSGSSAGYRGSGYTGSSDTYRRKYFSPARSVASYNETSSIVGTSSINGSGLSRYGSASSSSASSTASSNSSSASRERNVHQQHTPGSLATTAADLYAIYSPTNYVPNIHGTAKSNNNSSSNWRQTLSSSSSGILAELHGGDEHDSCRERRDRSYSSETSSVIGLTSITSNNHDRWSARRDSKRRSATPINGQTGSCSVTAGNSQKRESSTSPIEVTPDHVERTSRNSRCNEPSDNNSLKRRAKLNVDIVNLETSKNSPKNNVPIVQLVNELNDDVLDDINEHNAVKTINENRHVDNINGKNFLKNEKFRKNVDNDNAIEGTTLVLESRRRRRKHIDGNVVTNGETRIRRYDDDDTDNVTRDETSIVENHIRVNTDDNNISESISTRCNLRGNDHHRQTQLNVPTCLNDANKRKIDNPINIFSSLTDSPNIEIFGNLPIIETPTSLANSTLVYSSRRDEGKDSRIIGIDASLRNLVCDTDLDNLTLNGEAAVDKTGGGDSAGAGGDADHHRTAYTWTKLPTNIDNTELLTNNNVQERESLVVPGISDKTRNSSVNDDRGYNDEALSSTTSTSTTKLVTRIRERTTTSFKGTRKSLHWTTTSPNDDEKEEKTTILRVSSDPINVLTNGEQKSTDIINGAVKIEDNEDNDNSRLWDTNVTNGVTQLLKNGVRSSGNRSDESEKASTSRRTLFGWNDPAIDDLTSSTSSSSSSSSTAAPSTSSANNSAPVAVHQNSYRGINEPIDESSRPPRSRLQSRRDERYGLNGLRNIGNTCFMNSVIQCLSNTRPLLEYLLNEQHLHDINTTTSSMKGALIKAFGQVIQELWEISGDHVVNTSALKSQIQRFAPRFMGYSQQDAQEFLRYLLEGLHEDVNRVTVKPQPILTDIPDHYSDSHKASESWKRYLRSEDSMIVDVFVGQLRSSLHCTSCDHVSVTLDPFWDLSLPIPSRSGTVKLNQCLEHFTKVETLDGDEKPTCSKCQMRRKCTKSFSIQKFPKILVIHLKRFSPTERFRGKLSVLVDFPLTCLDLSAFAAPGVQGPTYNLYGVANHSGTTYSGHYTAYCKHPYSGDWHEYNDNRVSTVPARSVVSSEAYVLFYEQQTPSPHL